MIPPIHVRIPIILGLGVAAAYAIVTYDIHFSSKTEERIHALAAAGNCQTDVLGPFIQDYKLGHVPPAPAETFQKYVLNQVKANIVPEDVAYQTLLQIEAVGEGEPIHTERGWVMPTILAQQ